MTSTKLYAVVAMSETGVIGKGGKLPWPTIQKDMYRFRALTENQHVIMGRKTYESLPSDLPNRTKHVLTYAHTAYPEIPNTYFWSNKSDLHIWLERDNVKHALIIGGREIYNLYWRYIERIYMTIVHSQTIPGDTYFRLLDPHNWTETQRIYQELRNDTYDVSFITLEKKL